MKLKLRYLLIILILQACSSTPRVPPACEPNDETQYEYATSDSKFADFLPTLRAFNDYDAGIACAQRQGKPVFLAFTGFGARTRYFPDKVLQQEAIVNYLTTDFVPIILYVDDRQRIPEEKIKTERGTRILRNVGNYNSYLQETMFQVSSQPYMVLMTWEGELLAEPMYYNPDLTAYIKQFKVALEKYKTIKVSY